jgi:hypothetical protein
MELFGPVERALWVATSVAEALLLLRLLSLRLGRRYPLFCLYLAAEVLASAILIQFSFHGATYAYGFRIYTLISAILSFGVAAELYNRVCEHFPGIGSFRLTLGILLSFLALILSFAYIGPSLGRQWAFPQTVAIYAQRYWDQALAFGFILVWLFFRVVMCSRQPFRANVLKHWKIATIYFGGNGAASLLVLLLGGGRNVHPVNTAMLALNLGCQLAWLRSFRASGEEIPWAPQLTPLEIQTIRERDGELLRTVTTLRADITRRLEESREDRARGPCPR